VRVDANRGAEGSILAAWECTQPSWRADVEREIDLIEEVSRIYGLDKFLPRLPASRQGAQRLPHYEAETRLREKLIGLGYREIVTIPHVAEERNDLFRPSDAAPARLANPLSEEAGVLRSTGYVTMAGALEWNINHGQRNARLFEIGHHYRLNANKPVETRILTLGATGESREKNIYDMARDFSFADLKGVLDAIGALSGGFRWEPGGPEFLHAARRSKLFLGETEIGAAGQLARRVAEKFKLRQDIFLAGLNLGPVYCAYYGVKNARHYEPLPRFPAVERDFSLLVADRVTFAEATKTIQSLGIAEIISIEAKDLFRGKNVPAGKYSLLLRVTFQSRETTLTDTQIAEFSAKIIAAMEKQLGAQLRT
jgi:phenylalanyl-tRNA synthetase beta chain